MGLTTWIKRIANANGAGDRWVGNIDSARRDTIVGWAYDRQNIAASVAVEAVTDSGKSCVTMANRQSNDLRDAGHGTGRYGFVLDLKDEAVTLRFVEGRHPISEAPIKFDAQGVDEENSSRSVRPQWTDGSAISTAFSEIVSKVGPSIAIILPVQCVHGGDKSAIGAPAIY